MLDAQQSFTRVCLKAKHITSHLSNYQWWTCTCPTKFRSTVWVDVESYTSQHTFSTQKDDEQNVAKLDLKSLLTKSKDEGLLKCFMHKNHLQEYAQRLKILLPTYQTINVGHAHAPRFRSTVWVDMERNTNPKTLFPLEIFLNRMLPNLLWSPYWWRAKTKGF